MTALIATPQHDINYYERLAQTASDSSFYRLKPQDAALILIAGAELGLQPMQSLRAIHIINGKPTLSADLIAGRVLASGLAQYFQPKGTPSIQSVTYETLRKHAPSPVELTWTMEDAQRAGLLKNPTWKKYPRAMLRARCIAELARMVYPDVLQGIYTPEELGANVNEDGELVQAVMEEAPKDVEDAHVMETEIIEAEVSENIDYLDEIQILLRETLGELDALRIEKILAKRWELQDELDKDIEFEDLDDAHHQKTLYMLKKQPDLVGYCQDLIGEEDKWKDWNARLHALLGKSIADGLPQPDTDEDKAKEKKKVREYVLAYHDDIKARHKVKRLRQITADKLYQEFDFLRRMRQPERFVHIMETIGVELPWLKQEDEASEDEMQDLYSREALVELLREAKIGSHKRKHFGTIITNHHNAASFDALPEEVRRALIDELDNMTPEERHNHVLNEIEMNG